MATQDEICERWARGLFNDLGLVGLRLGSSSYRENADRAYWAGDINRALVFIGRARACEVLLVKIERGEVMCEPPARVTI